jgi:hypothetical protein
MKRFSKLIAGASAAFLLLADSAIATPVPRGAPGPEIGQGTVGAAVALTILLALVVYPRLRKR